MIRPIRSILTQEQIEIADNLKAIWLSRKDALELTQVKAAAAIGITQGAFTQHLNKSIATNTQFVLKLCELLKVDPAEVHPRFANIVLAEPHRVPITHEWGKDKPLRKPSMLEGYLLADREAFGIRLTTASPIPNSVIVCSRSVERPHLGWLTHGPRWTLTWQAQKPKPPAGRPWWNIVGIVAT